MSDLHRALSARLATLHFNITALKIRGSRCIDIAAAKLAEDKTLQALWIRCCRRLRTGTDLFVTKLMPSEAHWCLRRVMEYTVHVCVARLRMELKVTQFAGKNSKLQGQGTLKEHLARKLKANGEDRRWKRRLRAGKPRGNARGGPSVLQRRANRMNASW